ARAAVRIKHSKKTEAALLINFPPPWQSRFGATSQRHIKTRGCRSFGCRFVHPHQLYAMQKTQMFGRKLIEKAHPGVYAENASVTDEVSAVERLGHKIALVLHDDFNFKITYPRDLPV